MEKRVRKIAYSCLVAACTVLGVAGFCGMEKREIPTASANQTAQEIVFNPFVAPNSYEEYLILNAPSATAVCADYTAIADGNTIFIYDRRQATYKEYEHEENGAPQSVKNLQFCENGNLYFAADASGDNFFELSPTDFTKRKIEDIACEKFVINGSDLYFATAAGTLHTASLTSENAPEKLLSSESKNPTEPLLAFWNGELYFTDNGLTQRLYKLSPQARIPTPVTDLTIRAQSITINAGVLAYTTSEGDFYAYTLPSVQEENLLTHIENGGFTTLYSYGEFIYATQKEQGAVKEYSVTQKQFTDYEIASNSSSINRLHGATATKLIKNKLYTLDNGNNRISIYDTDKQSFLTPIPLSIQATYFACDNTTLLVANGNKAQLFDITSAPALLQEYSSFAGELKGVASVYGKYYLISDGYAYCINATQTNGEYPITETQKASVISPKLFTADIYGDLYFATGNVVYKFKEQDFMQKDTTGEIVCSNLPAQTVEIAVDYNRSLYALSQNVIHKISETGNPSAQLSLTQPLVYKQSVNAQSFSVSIEENIAYILCDGNYILQTQDLSLPSVKAIATNGIDQEIFSQNSAEFCVVKTDERAFTVRFNLHALENAELFPYLSYERQTQPLTALQLGISGDYCLLAVYNPAERAYTTYLTLQEFCSPLPTDTYQITYQESEQITGYLTNEIPLYKFPYLTGLLIADELARGVKITLLGEINELDHEYYQVAYQTETGERKTGFIPKTYVTQFDGTPPKVETVTVGETQGDLDSLWRLAYIVLGLGAIGILTDWLLLRKKEEE